MNQSNQPSLTAASVWGIAWGVASVGMLALLCLQAQLSVEGVQAGFALCYRSVLPALFPFFVVSHLIIASPLSNWLGIIALPYTHGILGIQSSKAGSALLLGWLGGFGVAAASVSQLYQQGAISRRDGSVLLVCSVGSGPAFVVTSVGMLMLGRPAAGLCLWLALLGANLVAGAVAAQLMPRQPAGTAPRPIAQEHAAPSLPLAMASALKSSLNVCGFVLFFSALQGSLTPLLPAHPALRAAIAGLLEVTGGCQAFATLGGSLGLLGCCGVLSLQSVSVLLQVRALTAPELSLLPLLAVRPVHLVLSVGLFKLLAGQIPGAQAAVSTLAPQVIPRLRCAPDAALVVFWVCCIVLLALHPSHTPRPAKPGKSAIK